MTRVTRTALPSLHHYSRSARIFAWGRNVEGQCGFPPGEDPIREPRLVPAAAHIDVGVVAAGRAHTAAVDRHGVAHTWGCRKSGKLGWKKSPRDDGVEGNESNNERRRRRRRDEIVGRVSLPPSPTFASAAALADDHTLVLDGDSGGVLAFGENKEGQLGIGSTFQELAKQHLANWSRAARESFCRELAEVNAERYSPPEDAAEDAAVAGTTNLTPTIDDEEEEEEEGQHGVPAWVVGGGQHRVGGDAAETLEGAHINNDSNKFNINDDDDDERWGASTAKEVKGSAAAAATAVSSRGVAAFDGKRVVSIAASRYFSAAAVADSGDVYTWGGGFNGELGQWGVSWCTSPRPVTDEDLTRLLRNGGGAATVAAGGNFCAAITTEGGLVVWGRPPPGLLVEASTPPCSLYSWPASGGYGGGGGVKLTGISCGRRHAVMTDGERVWVAGSVGGWEFGEDGHPEEITGLREFAERGGGIVSVAAGLGGSCGVVTGDGGLILFGAPVTHLGRGNLPDHDPTVPRPRTVIVVRAAEGRSGGGGVMEEEVLPGRDGVAVRSLALGGAHAVISVEGL